MGSIGASILLLGVCLGHNTTRHVCSTLTKQTCKWVNCTGSWGDNVECTDVDNICKCKAGYCLNKDNICTNNMCDVDTGGTCEVESCDESRGPTICVDGKCLCAHNTCNFLGYCRSGTCAKWTLGTCYMIGCNSDRHAVCQDGRCLCKKGACATVQSRGSDYGVCKAKGLFITM